jgi:fructokinase
LSQREPEESRSTSREPPTLVSWGELLWDLFPDGERLGGAAANVAYHAAQIGARAILVSRVGDDDRGRRACAQLEQSGVTSRFVQIDPERPTGTVHVEIRDGEPRYRIASEVAWDRIALEEGLAERMRSVQAVCYSTLAQRSEPGFDTLARAIAELPARAIRLCDLNVRRPFVSRALIERALGLATVAKLNEAEAELVAEEFGASDPVAWLLGRRGIQVVALTRGPRGALVASASESVPVPGVPLSGSGGDSVGAGDSFVAVLAVELARGTALPAAAERATRYSSYVASQSGAMPPIPAQLRRA